MGYQKGVGECNVQVGSVGKNWLYKESSSQWSGIICMYGVMYINDCRNLLTGERRRLGVRRPGFFTAQVFMSHKFN